MERTAIYQFITPLEKNSIYKNRKIYHDNFVPTVKKYADCVGAEYNVLGGELTADPTASWIKSFAWQFKATRLLEKMRESDYDKFLFLDEDVEVTEFSKNIFDILGQGFYMRPYRAKRIKTLKWNILHEDHKASVQFVDSLFNFGVVYICRSELEALCDVDVSNNIEFNEDGMAMAPPPYDKLKIPIDEFILSFKICNSKTYPKNLPLEWHCPAKEASSEHGYIDKTKGNFIHYIHGSCLDEYKR